MEKNKIIEQTKLAFDLIQKLYHEVAFLIKEIEGQLSEADENARRQRQAHRQPGDALLVARFAGLAHHEGPQANVLLQLDAGAVDVAAPGLCRR